jgi:hypothetical protein
MTSKDHRQIGISLRPEQKHHLEIKTFMGIIPKATKIQIQKVVNAGVIFGFLNVGS